MRDAQLLTEEKAGETDSVTSFDPADKGGVDRDAADKGGFDEETTMRPRGFRPAF